MCIAKMHNLFSHSVNKLTLLSFQNLLKRKNRRNVFDCCDIHTRSYSNARKQLGKDATKKVINFNDIINTRRTQAQRSILVQVNSEKSFTELQKYCSQYGTIVGAHHYNRIPPAIDQFILVEYSNDVEAKQAIEHCTFNDPTGICVRSPFLWFRAAQNGTTAIDSKISGKLMVTDGCRPIDYDDINKIMSGAESVTDQMIIHYKLTTLNDLGVRLRFLAARQIEESISGIFPKAEAYIFGSTVNGYGKLGCDLDLILRFNSMDSEFDYTKRLVFHTKKSMSNARSQLQRNLENLSDIMFTFLPGVSNVRKILQARVPIVRYHHEHLGLEVDLSMNNMSGVYMSELLYMFTQIDDRVSPLVSTIRRWAQTSGVTNASPGYWISNFSLTCLVIFYLQQLTKPILPTINALIEQARPHDIRIADEDGLQCTFLRDLNELKFTKENTDSLDQLLIGFFEFYAQMDFSERAISLNDAKLHPKPEHSAVYVVNPLEPILNVTKNISTEECERFRTEVRNAAWLLESSTKRSARKSDNVDAWGLLNLFRANQKPVIRPTMFFKSRMVEVKQLFDGTEIRFDNGSEKSVKFKNSSVKNQVANIQKKKRSDMDALKSGVSKR